MKKTINFIALGLLFFSCSAYAGQQNINKMEENAAINELREQNIRTQAEVDLMKEYINNQNVVDEYVDDSPNTYIAIGVGDLNVPDSKHTMNDSIQSTVAIGTRLTDNVRMEVEYSRNDFDENANYADIKIQKGMVNAFYDVPLNFISENIVWYVGAGVGMGVLDINEPGAHSISSFFASGQTGLTYKNMFIDNVDVSLGYEYCGMADSEINGSKTVSMYGRTFVYNYTEPVEYNSSTILCKVSYWF